MLPAAEIEYRGGCDEDAWYGYDEFGDVSTDLAEPYYIGDGICDDFNNNIFGSWDGGDCCCNTCEDPSGSSGTCDLYGGCSDSRLCAGPIHMIDLVTDGDTLAPTPAAGCTNFDDVVMNYTGGYNCDELMNSGQCELHLCSTCEMAGLCDASCGYCLASSPSIAPSEAHSPQPSMAPSATAGCVDLDDAVMNYTGGYDCEGSCN